jgi:hypothetical protein
MITIMNYKYTFFQVDPMVIFKQTSSNMTKVIRLDEDFVIEFEDHLSTAWKLLAENKSLDDVATYFTRVSGLSETEAKAAIEKLTTLLVEQNLGTMNFTKNEAT